MRRAVSRDDAVAAEIQIAFAFAEVAAVVPAVIALRTRADGLVDKIPDKAAAHVVVLFKILHVLAEIAEAVFHAVCVFAVHDGFILVRGVRNGLVVRGKSVGDVIEESRLDRFLFPQTLDLFLRRIHPADEIRFG